MGTEIFDWIMEPLIFKEMVLIGSGFESYGGWNNRVNAIPVTLTFNLLANLVLHPLVLIPLSVIEADWTDAHKIDVLSQELNQFYFD